MMNPPNNNNNNNNKSSAIMETRWEESQGTYRHKKFKKAASSHGCLQPPPPPSSAAASPLTISSNTSAFDPPLKHSALSMVSSLGDSSEFSEAAAAGGGDKVRRKTHLCPYCPTACAKPSVLDKHIRTHTNERPFPCDPCGFAFKTKSNLYKHRKSRTHILKFETGIDSPRSEIMAELGGESLHEDEEEEDIEMMTMIDEPVSPAIYSSSRIKSLGGGIPGAASSSSHEGHQIVQIVSTNNNSHPVVSASSLVNSSSSSSNNSIHKPSVIHMVDHRGLLLHGQRPLLKPPVQIQPTDLSSSPKVVAPHPPPHNNIISSTNNSSSSGGNPQSLQQRIDKVISENQAIVETLDPLWPRRYMRQNSKDEAPRSHRKYSLSSPTSLATNTPTTTTSSFSSSSSSSNNKPPPVVVVSSYSSSAALPLNLSEPSRKRPFPNSDSITTAKSVKELWLNSCRMSSAKGGSNLLVDVVDVQAQNLEVVGGGTGVNNTNAASATSNTLAAAFHPQNPEGSMIKELLLNTRIASSSSSSSVSPPLSVNSSAAPPIKKKLYMVSSSSNSSTVFCTMCSNSIRGTDLEAHQRTHCPSSQKNPAESLGLLKKKPPSPLVVEVSKPQEASKFLRPGFLPLAPGSFRPKKTVMQIAQGSTLASPETPRPRKSYVLQYQNGTAYTYLGLKSTTRVYYCSIFRPQPNFVLHKPRLSMYSNWRVVSKDSHPSRLSPGEGLSAYNSAYRKSYVMSKSQVSMIMTHSSLWKKKPSDKGGTLQAGGASNGHNSNNANSKLDDEGSQGNVEGGYKTTDDDDYTYVRGRGRGRYVCNSCGIRCKKPSMLKKHLRTHSNFRPYMCRHCNFAFKTKGNLTKHMKSKAHHKKCAELGVSPEELGEDIMMNLSKQGLSGSSLFEAGDSDSDDEDMDEDDEEEDDQFEDAEEETAEAVSSLLSLSSHGRHEEEEEEAASSCTYPAACFPIRDSRGLTPFSLRSSAFILSSSNAELSSSTMTTMTSSSTLSISSISETVSRNTKRAREFGEDGGSGVKFSFDKIYFPPPPNHHHHPVKCAPRVIPPSTSGGHDGILSTAPLRKPASMEESPLDDATQQPALLHDYLRERAAVKASSVHTTTTHVVVSSTISTLATSMSPLSSPPTTIPVSSIPSITTSSTSTTTTSSSSISSSDCPNRPFPSSLNSGIPRNVVMNVKDISNASKKKENGIIHPPEILVPPRSKAPEDCSSSTSSSSTGDIFQTNEDGKSVCGICSKVFSKPSQLRLHVNIHYFERPFRCESCAVSFRTKGHLQKHKRSVGHYNKVNINATFGAPTTANPRPFKCSDCKVAFRIHGHLAKHLRSKMHIMKLECSGKLPIGMFAEMERLGTNLNEIDTSDCENSLESLQQIAVKLYKKDPSKLTAPEDTPIIPSQTSDISDTEEDSVPLPLQVVMPVKSESIDRVSNSSSSSLVIGIHPEEQNSSSSSNHFREPLRAAPILPPLPPKQQQTPSIPPLEAQMEFERDKILHCSKCKISFNDVKSLQVHNYVEHSGIESQRRESMLVLPTPPPPPPPSHHHPHHQQQQHNFHPAHPPSHHSLLAPPPLPASSPKRILEPHRPHPPIHRPLHPLSSREEKTYDCELCGISILGSNPFSQHLMSHAAPRPYVCTDCDAGFPSTRQLEAHMQLHAKNP